MKNYWGAASGICQPTVGMICRQNKLFGRRGKILVSSGGTLIPFGYRGIITSTPSLSFGKIPTIRLENIPEDLQDGDCVTLAPDGNVTVVWQQDSPSNALLLTEKCNCRCIMCPQPPKPHDERLLHIASNILDAIDPEKTKSICITGGEPTLLGDKFLQITAKIQKKFPETDFLLLTNGKSFSDYQFAKKYAAVASRHSVTCVSLHSDLEATHDKIVGASGSFAKTIQGLYNLARLRMRVEIRHVISRLNADRLEAFARFVYRNFPFAYHVALMGMEMTELAADHYQEVWIDPADYGSTLDRATWSLHRTALNVSIYNIPLCLLPHRSWPFACQSISEWKNGYLSVCDECSAKANCAGIFTTSGDRISPNIRPIPSVTENQTIT